MIIPVIIGGVTIAMITSLKAADTRSPSDPACKTDPTCAQSTAERIAESHDSQITSALLVRDVQTATSLETTSAVPLCPRSGPTQGQQVLGIEWILGTQIYTISYLVEQVGAFGSYSLVRQICINGSFQSSLTAAHNVSSASGVSVTLVCTVIDPNCVQDTQVGPTSSLNVALVEFNVSESSGFTFTLSASPRQYLASTTGPNSATAALVASTPPLLLLGLGGAQCGSGNGLTVYGTLAVNSSAPGSVQVGNQGLTAQQVYSQNSNTGVGSGPVAGTYNPPVSYANGPALADPYSVLPAPSPFGQNTFVYNSTLTQGNDPTDPTHTKLLSGIYILNNGIAGSFTSDSPTSPTPGGVFLYVTGGSVTLTGGPDLNLSATNSGPYADMLLYQAPSDISTMTYQGSSPNATALNGVIDVSAATVDLPAGNSIFAALGLVSTTLTCNPGTSGTFGPIPTTTAVSSTLNPSLSGTPVTFTAAVSSAGGGTPTGAVTFTAASNGSNTPMVLCSNVALTGGLATCATSGLDSSGSPYTVTASYGGTLGYQSSSGSMTQNVVSPTSTTVTSSANPSLSGQSVQFSATVAGPGTATGSVQFTITDSSPVHTTYSCSGGSNLVALSNGSATCTVAAGQLSAANSPFTVTAFYGGDNSHSPSTGTLIQTVVSGMMHISALTGSGTLGSSVWTATVNVTVQDSFNNPVSGVVVTGSWNPTGLTPSGCTTGANGQCSFTTGDIPTAIPTETWTVSGLVLVGYAYDPTHNSASSVVINQ